MIRKKKKGFTVLELIIVIAIMGLMAGLSIPLLSGINNRNNHSLDQSLIKSLNNNLSLKEVENETSFVFFRDALKTVEDNGNSLDRKSNKSNQKILWNETNNRFVLEEERDRNIEDYHYWTVIDNYDENNQKYSMYASEDLDISSIKNLSVGFDIGNNTNIKSITYKREDLENSRKVTIFTSTGVDLTVDAPNDEVIHYGNANKVDIKAVKNSSFHEYGEVEELDITKGRYILEKSGYVKKVNVRGSDVIFATTLKKSLPNISFYGVRSLHIQVTSHNTGNVLLDLISYIDTNHHLFLNNVDTKESIYEEIEEANDIYYKEPDEPLKNQDIEITELTDSQIFANYLNDKLSFNADVNGSIKYKNNEYKIKGSFILNNDFLNNINYQLNLEINLGFTSKFINFTHVSNLFYFEIDGRNYLFNNDDLSSALEMFNKIIEDVYLPKKFISFTAKAIKKKLRTMTSEKEGDIIKYSCSILDDLAPINFTSDLSYNLKSISINTLEEENYSYNLDLKINNIATTLIDIAPSENDYLELKFGDLDLTTKNAIINQLQSIVSLKAAGFDYEVSVNRNNENTFHSEGKLDLKINDDNGVQDINFALKGNMVNPTSDSPLNSDFEITLLNDSAYFSYQNRLKISYERLALKELIEIIKSNLEDEEGNEDFREFANKFMPDNSTKDAPLFYTLFTSHNFYELLNYYKGISKDNGDIVIHFDSSIMNVEGDDILIKIDYDGRGISEINISNLYAYGYSLSAKLTLRDYQTIAVNNPSSYTKADYLNHSFNTLFNILKTKQFAFNLTGDISNLDDNSTTSFNGYAQFSNSDTINKGYGNITIHDKDNKNHNIILDVTKNNPSKDASEEEQNNAFNSSKVLFSYNSNLKGYFSLGSILDVYNLVSDLIENGDKRFDKYKSLILEEVSRSTLARLLNDEVESILYNDMITSISYSNNKYTIEINGNFLKKNDIYHCEAIYLDIEIDNNKNLKSLSIYSDKVLDYRFNITLDVVSYNKNLVGLKQDSSYKDFSDLKTLASYLLETSKRNTFNVTGSLDIDVDLFNIINIKDINIPLEAFVDIEEENGEEKVYSRVEMKVPYISSSLQNSKEWKSRYFYIYFTDTEVYLRTKTRTDSKEKTKKQAVMVNKWIEKKKIVFWTQEIEHFDWEARKYEWKEQYYTCQDIHLTMDQFFSNISYYLFNFGLDFEKDLSSYSGQNDNLDYSKIIKDYQFNNSSTPSWNVSIDMKELTTKSNYSDLSINLVGNNTTKEMQNISASLSMEVINIIDIDIALEASLDAPTISNSIKTYQAINQNLINDTKSYINFNKNHAYQSVYTSTYTYIASSTVTVKTDSQAIASSAPAGILGIYDVVNSFMAQPVVGDIKDISPSGYYITRT